LPKYFLIYFDSNFLANRFTQGLLLLPFYFTFELNKEILVVVKRVYFPHKQLTEKELSSKNDSPKINHFFFFVVVDPIVGQGVTLSNDISSKIAKHHFVEIILQSTYGV
jgi:hypothetical protein